MDGFEILMEIDTVPECPTISFSLHKEKLSHVKLEPFTVKLCQYDGTSLTVKGEIEVTVQKEQKIIPGSYVLFTTSYNCSEETGYTTTVELARNTKNSKYRVSSSSGEPIKEELTEVSKEELGLIVGLEAEIELKDSTSPKFCKPYACSISFTLHTQVEEDLQKQLTDGEYQPVKQQHPQLWSPGQVENCKYVLILKLQ